MNIGEILLKLWNESGFAAMDIRNAIMLVIGCVLLYLAIVKKFEPLLLCGIAFGCILTNLPGAGLYHQELWDAFMDANSPYYHSFSNAEKYGEDMQQYVNGLWEQLKTETDVEIWVHVSSITIVVVLLAACSYSIYVKKKRSKFYRQRDKEAKA